jgi:hypothetical protein
LKERWKEVREAAKAREQIFCPFKNAISKGRGGAADDVNGQEGVNPSTGSK